MKRIVLVTMGLLISSCLIFVFYKPLENTANIPNDVLDYINAYGYRIVGCDEERTWHLTKENLKITYLETFHLMGVDIREYLGMDLILNFVYVTNHPFDNDFDRLKRTIKYGFKTGFPNKTKIVVVKLENNIIGSYSLDVQTRYKLLGNIMGDIYGRSIEELLGKESNEVLEDLMIERDNILIN